MALKNPMRFSLRHDSINLEQYDVEFTKMEMVPSEGQIYLHWDEDTRPDN